MLAIYTDETAAREHLEALLWPSGAVCPRCKGQEVTRLAGKSTRPGVWKCRPCRKPFTVTAGGFAMRDLGTVFNVRLTERELELLKLIAKDGVERVEQLKFRAEFDVGTDSALAEV